MSNVVAATPALTRPLTNSGGQMLMKGLLYSPSITQFGLARTLGTRMPIRSLPLRLVALPELERRGSFERLKVRLCGISTADLAVLYGQISPAVGAQYSFPAVLGHEILAELGGVRVVVNPLLSCHERGLPDCEACERGEDNLCHNRSEGNFAPGMMGFCRDLSGGWAQRLLAHRERILPVPEGVPDARAVLCEPMAVAHHGVRKLGRPANLLVIGAGTLGLLAVGMLRALGYDGHISVVEPLRHRADLAKQMGADTVYGNTQAAQQANKAKRYRTLWGTVGWRGGYAAVIEASSTARGLYEASWAVGEGGRLLMLGVPATALHDFSPYWLREVQLLGSYGYTWDDFAQTVRMLPELEGAEGLVSHQMPLEAWPEALQTAARKRGVKVVFKPN